ncbi:MAG: AAA family ATPase, partial [Planctomycetota bacterium]
IGQLIAAHPKLHEPVIDGLLRRGETANIVADPKRGKSWLSYGIALSVATGLDWLGFPTTAGRVLLVDNELHEPTIAHRIPKVAKAMGIEEEDYRHQLDVIALRGHLLDLQSIARMLSTIERGEYSIVILDAWYRAIPKGVSENDNPGIMQLYNLIDQTTAALDSAWLNIHHASKGNQSGKSVTDVGSGAGSQSRAADTHIVLRKHQEEGVVALDAAVRSFPPIQPVCLRWEFPLWHRDLSYDPGKLDGLLTNGEKRQSAKDQEACDPISKSLAKGDLSGNDLATAAAMGKDRCQRLVGVLMQAGKVTDYEGKKGHQACKFYHLEAATDDDDSESEF